MEPSSETISRTFRLELGRSFSVGVLETGLFTFAVLIAVKYYETGPLAKALIVGSQSAGLMGSLFVMPLCYRLRWPVTRLAAVISMVGAVGFLTAAVWYASLTVFVAGVSLGFFCLSFPIPLQTQYLRENYPNHRRGKLFSVGNALRAVGTIVFSLLGGWILDVDFSLFPVLLLVFAGFSLCSAWCVWRVPTPPVSGRPVPRIFQAIHWVRDDAAYRSVLISAMIMGAGVLTLSPLRVEYLANERYGLLLTAAMVSFLTGLLPSLLRLVTTFFWGVLFDRVNFYRLRISLNLLFGVAFFLFFATGEGWLLILGASLFGVARGGGEIMWNLWVTKLAPREHAAEYMSVHTCLTGLRGLVGPFAGFYLVEVFTVQQVMYGSVSLILLSTLWLVPQMRRLDREKDPDTKTAAPV